MKFEIKLTDATTIFANDIQIDYDGDTLKIWTKDEKTVYKVVQRFPLRKVARIFMGSMLLFTNYLF